MMPPLTVEKFIYIKKSNSDFKNQLMIKILNGAWMNWGFVDYLFICEILSVLIP